MQGLLPGKIYHFRVAANSNFGPGDSSQILEVVTQPEENMAGPPENFRGAAMSHDEIFLQWDPPRESNGAITKYRVYFAEGDNGEDQTADTTSNEFMLTQLRAYCEYTISVVAFNQNGMGNPSQEMLLKTFSNTPSDPPSNISVEASSSTVSEKLIKTFSPLLNQSKTTQPMTHMECLLKIQISPNSKIFFFSTVDKHKMGTTSS